MKKATLIAAAIITIIILVKVGTEDRDATFSDKDMAIHEAKKVYEYLKEQGIDFTEGPCIAESVMVDWAVDIVHNPRNSQDDLPQNICTSMISGTAKHIIELDRNGVVLKAE